MTAHLESVASFIDRNPRLFVLTGAGVSKGSGLPTYRDDQGQWQHSKPIQDQEYRQQPEVRKRYWSRSAVGWPLIAGAKPNSVHFALAKLEAQSRISCLVTQNVDRLHQKAGHRRVIDLHGRLDRALCLACGEFESRDAIQLRLLEENPFLTLQPGELTPDGDANIDDSLSELLREPLCLHCGGLLKPDVVFFGGSVPRPTVEAVYQELEKSDAMLVVGSSLMVYSGYRFCKRAKELGKPLLLINQGKTRADDLVDLKIEQDCGKILSDFVRTLLP